MPELNDSLQILHCSNNHLTYLPEINYSLQYLYCYSNLLTSFLSFNDKNLNQTEINRINNIIQRLYSAKSLFWCLKYKQKFRDWLWVRVRLPKIEQMYHPSKLNKLLNTDMSEEELDNVLSNW